MSSIRKLFWISLLVKLVLAAVLPLTNDEAYYWVWSRHMQLSYYDHPPFVAWLFWLGDFVRWFPGSVRWPGVLLGQATLAIWLITLRPYLKESQRYIWLWMMLLSPLLGGSGLLVTPDLPLLFFYSLSLFIFFRWLKNDDWRLALAFGLSMGLGFSSKYMMALFVIALLPIAIFSAALRKALLRNLHWLVLGGLVGTAPVWLWNLFNDFASFRFQATHGLGRAWKVTWTLQYVLAQIALISPSVIWWALRSRRKLPFIFHCMAWTPLIFFFFTTFRGYVEANWPIAAYPFIFALAATTYPVNARPLQFMLCLWGFLFAVVFFILLAQPPWSRETKFKEFHQFDGVITATHSLEPLYARSYQMAAKMHFELQRPVYKLKGMNRRDFYDYMPESEPSGSVYYLVVEKGDNLPPSYRTRGDVVMARSLVDDRYEIWKVQPGAAP